MNKNNTPRKPTEAELDELVQLEESRLDPNGGPDVGDLGYMLDQSYIIVIDNFKQDVPEGFNRYEGKYMLMIWGLRLISEYVWINNQITLVDETNRQEIW